MLVIVDVCHSWRFAIFKNSLLSTSRAEEKRLIQLRFVSSRVFEIVANKVILEDIRFPISNIFSWFCSMEHAFLEFSTLMAKSLFVQCDFLFLSRSWGGMLPCVWMKIAKTKTSWLEILFHQIFNCIFKLEEVQWQIYSTNKIWFDSSAKVTTIFVSLVLVCRLHVLHISILLKFISMTSCSLFWTSHWFLLKTDRV